MTLDDLKIGMVLIDRNGIKKVVFNDGYFGYISKVGIQYGLIENYFSNNLISKSSDVYDIVKIEYGGKVIWERNELPKLTKFEKRLLRELYIDFTIIYQDCNWLYVISHNDKIGLNKLFPKLFKTLEPNKEYLIEDLLK